MQRCINICTYIPKISICYIKLLCNYNVTKYNIDKTPEIYVSSILCSKSVVCFVHYRSGMLIHITDIYANICYM